MNKIDLSNRLYLLITIFLAAIALCGGFFTWGSLRESTEYNQISVEGTSTITMSPDIAYVSLGVSTENEDSATALTENMETMDAVMQAIKDFGIGDENVQTQNFSVYPNYDYVNGDYTEVGYEAMQSVKIKITDFTTISDLILKTSEAGANQFNSVNFELEEYETQLETARADAIKEAREKALSIADASGARLGRLMSYYEYTDDQYGYGKGGGGELNLNMESATAYFSGISAGEEDITLTVSLSYRIK